MSEELVSGFALLCDADGNILRILYDQQGISEFINPYTSLQQIVDIGSIEKINLFITALRQQGLIVDWEIDISLAQPAVTFLLSGVVISDQILIVGSKSHDITLALFEELTTIHNELSNTLRSVTKDLSLQTRSSVPVDPNMDIYNQLSAVNNQLVNTQRALAKANMEVRAQRDRFHVTLSSIAEAVIAADTTGKITFMNLVAEQMTGWTNEEITNQYLDDIVLITDEQTQSPIESPIVRVKRDTQAVELVNQCLRSRKRDVMIPIDLSCAPIRSHDNKLIGYVIVFRDISDRKYAEEQALALSVEKERTQILADFIRDASHDLRTPISIMMTSLDLFEMIDDPDTKRRHIEKLRNQTVRLHSYTESLITMTTLDAVKQLELVLVDVNDVIKTVFASTHVLAETKQQNMTLSLDDELPRIPIDIYYFDLALTNLIKNAIFFTPERGAISISSFSSGKSVCIQVTDTGIGIEEDELSCVFDRFYRVESARSSQTGGSGLGLSIAKRVVELHSGVIQLESLPNHGSVFRIIM